MQLSYSSKICIRFFFANCYPVQFHLLFFSINLKKRKPLLGNGGKPQTNYVHRFLFPLPTETALSLSLSFSLCSGNTDLALRQSSVQRASVFPESGLWWLAGSFSNYNRVKQSSPETKNHFTAVRGRVARLT